MQELSIRTKLLHFYIMVYTVCLTFFHVGNDALDVLA